jgi:hypothetical protein
MFIFAALHSQLVAHKKLSSSAFSNDITSMFSIAQQTTIHNFAVDEGKAGQVFGKAKTL